MLNLIQAEFSKLRRRSLVWLMLLTALIMPILAMLLFWYKGDSNVNPAEFYRWSAFGATLFVILPVVLGMFSTMLMYTETQNDTLKQLWMVPVSRGAYLFSKFFVMLLYSLFYMVIAAVGSAVLSIIPGYVDFKWNALWFLFEKSFEVGFLVAFSMIPILAVAAVAKGAGFFLMTVNMYLHPICSTAAIVMRAGDIPGVTFPQPFSLLSAILCIAVWDTLFIIFACLVIKRE